MLRSQLLIVAILMVGAGCKQNKSVPPPETDQQPKGKEALPEVKDKKPMDDSPDLETILKSLQSPTESTRESANSDLFRLRHRADQLTVEDGIKALRAAAQPYPFDKPKRDEVSENLVDVAAQKARREYIPLVAELFDKFSDRGKVRALIILTDLDDEDAAKTYMSIVRIHANAGGIPNLPTGRLERKPRHAKIFFPELLEYASIEKLRVDIYRLCFSYAEAGLLKPDDLAPHSERLLAAYRALAKKLKPMQKATGVTWMWEDVYTEFRFDAGLLLDLLGYFPASKVENDLREALDFQDSRLKAFAIAALMRLGKQVDAKHLAEAVSHAEMRNYLYDTLKERGKLSLYPDKFKSQAAFAESDMVRWLTYPTELGRVPDEIELMKVVPIVTGHPGGTYEYYLFRFRTHPPHWAAKDGWMAGVAGPFRQGKEPTTEALGDTFSTFSKWDSKKPDEHVGDINALMKRWREYHRAEK